MNQNVISLGKYTTVEGADNGIILRHPFLHPAQEFFVGLPAEDALLELLLARQEARRAAEIAAYYNPKKLQEKLDALQGKELDRSEASDFADFAAAVFIPVGGLVSWDGIDDGLFEFVVTEDNEETFEGYKKVRVSTVDEVKTIILNNHVK